MTLYALNISLKSRFLWKQLILSSLQKDNAALFNSE